MKNIVFVVCFFLIIQICLAGSPKPIKADNPLIEYTGRIDFSNKKAPQFSYSGVSIRAAFQGKSISVILEDEKNENYYNVIIDQVVISRIKTDTGKKIYELAKNLKDTIHEIELFKLTEEQFGKTRFHGFVLAKGKRLVKISNERTRVIEYIGNSITCGYGNEGQLGQKFGASTENHYLTYAAFTSRAFNARHLPVCKSGIGIYRNYGDPAEGSPDCMTNNYARVFLYDPQPEYDFNLKPDLICIDLGTNDFSTKGGDSAKYVNKFLQFIEVVQTKNKGTDVLCLLGPMISGTDLDLVRRCLQYVVEEANKKAHGNVYFFEMSAQKGDLGIGIDHHPTVAQHMRNGTELTNFISKLKGWSTKPLPLNARATNTNEIVIAFNTELQPPAQNNKDFIVSLDGQPLSIITLFADPTDKSKIHILLTEKIEANKKLTFSYSPGSIVSKDNQKVSKITEMKVDTRLIELKELKIYRI